jgi:hypothetical protein
MDPHSDVYACNEENMLDWEGHMSEPSQQPRILLETITEDTAMAASLCISSVKTQMIDTLLNSSVVIGSATSKPIPNDIDDDQHLHTINPLLVATSTMASSLSERASFGNFAQALVPLLPTLMTSYDINLISQLDLDEYMLSSADATNTRGVPAEQLSKVWRIDLPTATKTIDVTSQRCVQSQGDNLSHNYITNDRMLRYRRINEHFFMDTFFATKKSRKSSRGHTCMQLFVTNKGFVYVVPMTTKGEVTKSIKLFAKEIGAPDGAIICVAAREQISKEIRSFCTKMGTALRVLEENTPEENTPRANRVELYIGIVKEAVQKDMKEYDCPFTFWDYCTE